MTASDPAPGTPDASSDRATFDVLKDVYVSVVFLTRLPAPAWPEAEGRRLATAMWAFPVAGVLVATVGGLVFALGTLLSWPTMVSALLAVVAMILATGGLHEDGLADFADGVWGGATPERRLEIMSDSRIGAYGAIALIVSIGIRAAAIAELNDPGFVLGALVAAAAVSRATIPVVMAFGTPAKSGGLGAGAGKPDAAVWAGGLLIAVLVVVLAAPGGWFTGVLGAAAGAALVGWFAARSLGGYTGDTLGATQQTAEIFALAFIAAVIPVVY